MKLIVRIITGLLCLFPIVTYAQTEENAIPGELIIMLKPNASIQELIKSENIQNPGFAYFTKQEISKRYNIWLLGYNFQNAENQAKALSNIYKNRNVALAQHNHYVQLRATPNDASFATQQWSMNNTGQGGGTADADIDATEAWDITTGGITVQGDTIVVAVIDGGFQLDHPDLVQNIYKNYAEINGVVGVDDDNNGYIDDINGWDAYNNDGIIPSDQHGTHVSGIIGARGNNSIGVAGVNWNVKIMTIAGSSGTEATVVAAYNYAATMRNLYNQTNGAKGAYVVSTNSSFGVDLASPSGYPIWCAFYDSLGAAGILSAAATANANYNVDTQGDIPTACPSNFMISVTNTTNTDAKNNSCGYGLTTIDLGSPGTAIYSTVTGSNYQNLTGTSMATPHVAGTVGLMYAAACDQLITDSKQSPAATALQMKSFLLNGTDPIASMAGITVTGGRLNLFNALQNVQTYQCDTTQPPNAGFSASNIAGCPGLSVTFNNNTFGNGNSYQWIFPGGNPSSSADENPTVTYSSLGTYDVTLIATNAYGQDTLFQPGLISVNNSSLTDIYIENFESLDFSTTGWSVSNPDGLNTWQLGAVSGNNPGAQAAFVNIFDNQGNAGAIDGLTSPVIDLTNYGSVQLYFEHAHRRRVATIADSLWVSVSLDGGLNFPFRVLSKGGGGNPSVFATGTLLTTSYSPTGSGDWCFADNSPGCFTVDLSQFDGQANVKLRFDIQNNGGNNIYIDNVKLTGVCAGSPQLLPPVAQFSASSTTICEKTGVQFTDQSQNGPVTWAWTFQGGTPNTASIPNPFVTYNTPGTFLVTLKVTNAAGNDSLAQSGYITVGSSPNIPVITQNGGNLQSSYATGNQWFLNGNPISGQTGQSITPSGNGTYTVSFTSPEGCVVVSEPFTLTVGVETNPFESFEVYPNPIKDDLFVRSGTEGTYSIRILDLSGRVVMTKSNLSGLTKLDCSSMSIGVYLIELNLGGMKKSMKIVKNK